MGLFNFLMYRNMYLIKKIVMFRNFSITKQVRLPEHGNLTCFEFQNKGTITPS